MSSTSKTSNVTDTPSDTQPTPSNAKFVTGSTMRHVLVMASAGAVGLVAIFFVDVLNLFYISKLGQKQLAAAIGYSSTIMFFSISISVGFTIAAAAITGRELGKGNEDKAARYASIALIFSLISGVVVAVIVFLQLPNILYLLGAQGKTFDLAHNFMRIVIPSVPLLFSSMTLGGILRAVGDAKRSMYITLIAAGSAAVIDPLMIFGFDLGLTGAAISVFIVRIIMVMIAWHGTFVVHKFLARPDWATAREMTKPFIWIAFPAVLTQVATPVGNAYVTSAISEFGDDAVAGWAIVGRLVPLAFAALYALSGAVGPILSQNYGAGRKDRVKRTMRDSVIFSAVYAIIVWIVLAITSPWIITLFGAEGEAASMISFFCVFVAGSFIFNGMLFVANAAFNNLDHPIYSTFFNWGRATVGIIPFVYVGSYYGANGVIAGWGLGGLVFGAASMVTCFRVLNKLPDTPPETPQHLPSAPSANSPFTSGKGSTFLQD